jgi:hypothetical protein
VGWFAGGQQQEAAGQQRGHCHDLACHHGHGEGERLEIEILLQIPNIVWSPVILQMGVAAVVQHALWTTVLAGQQQLQHRHVDAAADAGSSTLQIIFHG